MCFFSLTVSPLIALEACDSADQFTVYLRRKSFSVKNIKFAPFQGYKEVVLHSV